MREIKFRAWIDRGEYGYWATLVFDQRDTMRWSRELLEKMSEDATFFEFATPMYQYTGLKDKNGKEIYEGDIVHIRQRDGWKEKWTVVFREGRFEVFNQLNSSRDFETDYSHTYGGCPIVHVVRDKYEFYPEVIGNIYENKELLNEA